jgi:hypothetical protein
MAADDLKIRVMQVNALMSFDGVTEAAYLFRPSTKEWVLLPLKSFEALGEWAKNNMPDGAKFDQKNEAHGAAMFAKAKEMAANPPAGSTPGLALSGDQVNQIQSAFSTTATIGGWSDWLGQVK